MTLLCWKCGSANEEFRRFGTYSVSAAFSALDFWIKRGYRVSKILGGGNPMHRAPLVLAILASSVAITIQPVNTAGLAVTPAGNPSSGGDALRSSTRGRDSD
jgi:hypothetical protein